MIRRWTTFTTAISTSGWVRGSLRTLYYLAIIAGLLLLYGKGDFSTPKFIYQGF